MLACARLGAVHSVVFGGFASHELAKRIDDAEPKLVLTASCALEPGRVVAYKPLLDAALDLASHKVPRVIILQRPELAAPLLDGRDRSEEHTSELQSLMRISYAVFCLKKKKKSTHTDSDTYKYNE